MPDSNLYNQISGHLTVNQVINQFLQAREIKGLAKRTILYYRDELARFEDFAIRHGYVDILSINAPLIRAFLAKIAETRNQGGVHASYRPLRALLYWYEKEFEPEAWKNPINKIDLPTPGKDPIPGVSMEDYGKLIAVSKGKPTGIRDVALFMCLLDTCARATEFINFNLSDVDLSTGSVLIRSGKGSKPRFVRIGNKARRALRKYLKTRPALLPSSPLFETQHGGRFTYNGLVSFIRWRSGQAKIAQPGLHDIRRAGALELLRNGADLAFISRYLGHSSVEVTMRYLAMTPDDIQRMHSKSSPVDNAPF